jgi:hypothetical protein
MNHRLGWAALIIALLALGGVVLLWWKCDYGGDRPAVTTAGALSDQASGDLPAVGQTDEVYSTAPNAQLPGRIGRIVVTFPEGADASQSKVSLLPPSGEGDALDWRYGSAAFDVMPGLYVVDINSVRLQDVEVESQRDTVIEGGALRVKVQAGTKVSVLDMTRRQLDWSYGPRDFCLPVGQYLVEITGQVQPVTIEENRITEF